jgi:lysophospholipase L1-like esterase
MICRNAELHNVRELVEPAEGEGRWMSRVPEQVRQHLNEKARQTALNGCGCEIRFNLIGKQAKIVLQRDRCEGIQERGLLEIYHGPFQSAYEMTPRYIGNERYEIVIDADIQNMALMKQVAEQRQSGFDPELVRILLPFDWRSRILDIEGEIAPPKPEQTPARKLLVYGSSITHGGSALAPSGSYAFRTAVNLNMDLLNFGFAGSAQMEREMADFISESADWDIAILELGVNVLEEWSTERFADKVNDFITAIARRDHKLICCTDIFTMRMDLEGNPKVGHFRDIVKEAVERLGLPGLHYLSGKELFADASLLSADLVHPSARGAEAIAEKMTAWVRKKAEAIHFPF